MTLSAVCLSTTLCRMAAELGLDSKSTSDLSLSISLPFLDTGHLPRPPLKIKLRSVHSRRISASHDFILQLKPELRGVRGGHERLLIQSPVLRFSE